MRNYSKERGPRYSLVQITSWDDSARGPFRLRLDGGFVCHDERGRLVADREGRGDLTDAEKVREGARLALGYQTEDGQRRYALLVAAEGSRWSADGTAGELVLEDVELRAGPFETWSAFEAAARVSERR